MPWLGGSNEMTNLCFAAESETDLAVTESGSAPLTFPAYL